VPEVARPGGARDATEELYREVVLEHYRRPRHREPLGHPDGSATVDNPVCGDQVRVEVRLDGSSIGEISARVRGCSIAVAAGSIMGELVIGCAVDEIPGLRRALQGLVDGEPPDESLDRQLRAFAGVSRFPARRRCATLPWEALEEALKEAGG
jgi:nitrogen fixation NifU-like protein